MASKKYTLILGILSLFSSAAYSQRNDAGYDWRDSAKLSTKSLPQHSEFLNNQYPYPAMPRSMWELGIAGGTSFIIGDVSSNPFRRKPASFKTNAGIGGAITLRKALGHTFSIRGGYAGAFNQGEPNFGQRASGLRNYKNWMHSLTLDAIASLNTSSHYRGNPRTNIYVLAGANLIASKTFVRIPGGRQFGPNEPYGTFYGFGAPSSTEVGTITTFGGNEVNARKGWALLPGFSGGGGIAFKVSDKFNIGLEQKFTLTGYDYLDAASPARGRSADIISFTSARLNFNLGSAARKVQPLWWLNPYNFIYNELNAPQHMKLPTPILPDADGDGVTDQFDMEPNTPQGAPVDARGVSRDTDGDGVPDYKDKELLTPQRCFPVDADGVGNCPEPACCKELRDLIGTGGIRGNCGIDNLPSVQFRSGTTLSRDARAVLTSAAAQIKANPTCKIRVTGHGASDKRAQQLSWDRVNAVIRFLVEQQGISEDRFIFTYGEQGDPTTVDLSGTTEEGPNTVPAPHPNLRRG